MRLRHIFALTATLWLYGEPVAAQQRTRPASPDMWRHWAWVCRSAVGPWTAPRPRSFRHAAGARLLRRAGARLLVRKHPGRPPPPPLPGNHTHGGRRRARRDGYACTVARPSGEPRLDASPAASFQVARGCARSTPRPAAASPRDHELSAEWEITDTRHPFTSRRRRRRGRRSSITPICRRVSTGGGRSSCRAAAHPGQLSGRSARGGVRASICVCAETGIESCQIGVSSGMRRWTTPPAASRAPSSFATRGRASSAPMRSCRCSGVGARGGSHIRFPLPFGRNVQAPLMDPADTRLPDARRALRSRCPMRSASRLSSHRGPDDDQPALRRGCRDRREGRPTPAGRAARPAIRRSTRGAARSSATCTLPAADRRLRQSGRDTVPHPQYGPPPLD